ncbi:MAG: SDR family oxidoreductase [Proteobacteria bacterium]|nr:SDR family oxidoreductase [Pseudomonadota bacterium]MCP4915915.1 SDR family oxidoreductase [Pseudomonadota bacterium]
MKLNETRALVTGGGRGMGKAFVQSFKDAGAAVFTCDVNPVEGGTIADVSNEEDVVRLFAEAEEALGGPVNCLVNNAGIIRDGLLVKKDKETGEVRAFSTKKWQQVIDVNLTGPFLCMRQFAQRCLETETRPAVAINMSSISRSGNAGQTNYAAAKAGLVADTVLWAKELARYDIRVAAIAPGFIRTPMVESMPPHALERALKPVPMRRLGEPEEIFSAIRFIVECGYFTGRVVEVDGGLRL